MGRGNSTKGRKRIREPHVTVPKGRKYFYVAGTLQTSRGKVRLTGSTGIGIDEINGEERANIYLQETLIPSVIEKARTGREDVPFSSAALAWVKKKFPDGMMAQKPDPETGERKPTNADERNVLELAKHFGITDMYEMSRENIDEYYAMRYSNGQSPDTVRRHQNTLVAIFNDNRVPVPDFDRPKAVKRKGKSASKILEPDEVRLLVESFPERLHLLIWLYFIVGARASELLYLEREHFPRCEKVILPKTKSDEADVIELPEWYTEKLREHLRSHNRQRVFLTRRGIGYARPKNDSGPSGLRKVLYTAREKAAKALEKEERYDRAAIMRRVTIHWGRHTAANTLLDQGIPKTVVREALRWSSDRVLDEHYIAEKKALVKGVHRGLPFSPKD